MSNSNDQYEATSSTESVLELLRGELSSKRRRFYRFVLLCSLIALGVVLSLWLTEPKPLPIQTQIAFGAMCCIASGWVAVLTWILIRRNCPTAMDRMATSWVATVATTLSLVLSVSIALWRGQWLAAMNLTAIGLLLVAAAGSLLFRAYRQRAGLKKQLNSLRTKTTSRASAIGLILISLCLSSGVNAQDNLVLKQKSLASRPHPIRAEFGRLTVPMNRQQRSDKKLSIAFVRVKGIDPAANPTFILAGGPGDSGIRIVKGMFSGGAKRIQSMLRGDIIGIDQRGVGASTPNLDYDQTYGFSISEPGSLDTYAQTVTTAFQDAAIKLRKQGIDLSAFNTNENADDIEALRIALGYEKINLWGTSYGTHLGLIYLRRYPDAVERAMFCSPEGPNDTFKRPAQVDRVLKRISSSLGGKLLPMMRRVHNRLDKEPAKATVVDPNNGKKIEVGISRFDIQLLTWTALGRVEKTKQLMSLYEAMDRGEFEFPARWLVRYRRTASIGSVMKYLMDTSSGYSTDRRESIFRESDDSYLGPVVNFPLMQSHESWGVSPLGDEFRHPVSSDVPVLMIVGDLDARTPIENAKELQRRLPNSEIYISKGGGHGFVPKPDILKKITQFFN